MARTLLERTLAGVGIAVLLISSAPAAQTPKEKQQSIGDLQCQGADVARFDGTIWVCSPDLSLNETATVNAQTTADGAQTAATNAQTTADAAETAAMNAQATADSALTAAGNAQFSADAALAITDSQDIRLTDLEGLTNGISSGDLDSRLTDVESTVNDLTAIGPGVNLAGQAASDTTGTLLNSPDLRGANLAAFDCTGCTVTLSAKFNGANLASASFQGSSFSNPNNDGVSFMGANLTNARFDNSSFDGRIEFQGANLTITKFTGSVFQGSLNARVPIFAGAYGYSVNFDNVIFQIPPFFTAAILPRALFRQANVSGGYFNFSELKDARFQNTIAVGADFTGANLTGANFGGADLTDVIWSNTTCPDGTNSDDNGGTCIGHL